MATLKSPCGLSPSRPLSHTVCVVFLAFLGVFAQGQGPGTQNNKLTMNVMEEKPSGVVVGTLPIRGGYSYSFEQTSTMFELDREGVIRTKIRIDREALVRQLGEDTIDLFVEGTHPTEAFHPIDVTIRVLDLNDNAPRFAESRISVSFQEDAQAGQQQLLDTALDPDNGMNGTITDYSIVSGNQDRKFRLIPPNTDSPYMFIVTEGNLDRETRDVYHLNISARDGGDTPLTGYLALTIDITDVNDIPPTFEYSDYVTQVNESADVGTSVIRVEATDGDLGDNGQIFYFLTDSSGQFTINERTGVIRTLTSPLQCSRQCGGAAASDCNPYSCLMTVLARDGGRTPQEGRARITVAIIDENDHDPIITFYPQNMDPVTGYATIDENAMGLRVASISVRDADHGVNGETSVQIIAGNEAGHFQHVYLSTGTVNINYISVQQSLDRETIAMYNLTLKAVDHGRPPRSSTAYLIIVVNDANDHAPVFEKAEYRTQMSELAMPGSSVAGVKAVDEDSGPNSQLTYTIVAGNNQSWFAIDDATGLVTTRVALDHETTQRVVLNISARDSGTTPFTNYTRLIVDIVDENDMAPRFGQDTVRVEVAENQPAGREIITLTAVDYDSGVNGTVSYRLHPDTQLFYSDTFQVDAASGQVSARKLLDRETISYYVIKMIAKDGGRPSLLSTATVYLSVTDQNDNVPVFQPTNYYVNVFETDPAGIPVVQVSAVDIDSGLYGRVTYGFTGSVYGEFRIDQYTGMISTTTQLRRSVRNSFQLSVTARDAGGRSSQEAATVNVIVGSVNDAAPVFSNQPVTFEITEDNGDQALNVGQTVGQIQATGGGGSIRYGITDGDPLQVFSIDGSGVIRRDKLVDHEVRVQYILTVIAHTGSKFGEKGVTISVLDLNDNKPHFLATSTETVVMEDWPVGDNIFLAGAVDDDSGPNARLTYTLSSMQDVSGVFGIDPQTGIISLQKPTTQLSGNSQVTLTVRVQDAGTPPQTNSMDVVVKIQDVNDHTPVFPMNVYRFHLLESRPVNQVFMQFVATDVDEGRNGELEYGILRGNEERRFGIFPDGQLFVAHGLDRESRDMYSLTVQVRDCGDARRSSTANVTIYILDANDNSPVFNNASYTFTVAENKPGNTLVGSAKATDNDISQNAEVVYSLTEGNANFSINPISGEIFTRRPFDREYIMDTSSVEFYTFDVFATDGGSPRLRGKSTVRVYVTDVNDNPPVFARPLFNAAVAENAARDTKVIKMTATDIDTGANSAVSYVIVKGNEEGKFKIATATGEITVNGTLDRETVDQYMLTVEATDTGAATRLSSSAQVSITIIDYNDNTPVFTSTVRELRVEETRPLGELLTVFSGKDADLGNNAKIFFSIYSGNEEGVFNLDGYTGKLYLVRELDYETRREYTLNVSVTDAGYHPSLSSHTFLTVKVIDVNDNAPLFKDGFSSINVREDVRSGLVATLKAEDKDSGDFGVVQFAIISQDPNENAFSISQSTGEIFVSGALDREKTDYYKLTITATDQANPASLRHTAQRTLRISIGDVNDNAPVFRSPPAYVVSTHARSGQIIAEVFADDADKDENGVVTYSLVSQTSLFSIGSSNGQISLLQNMPSDRMFYTLRVLAIDNGNSGQNDRLSTETIVTIILTNNEPGPVFFNTPYSGSFSESAVAGTNVLRVSASASRPEVQVEYYLTGITSGGVQRGAIFRVDASSGEVTNTVQLDREVLGGTFTLEITAMEQGATTPRTRSVQATVTLRDVNDTPPRFSPSVYSVNYPENSKLDPSVLRVVASDPDTTGQLTLRLNGEGSTNFDIRNDGTIVAVTGLDRETQDLYRLSVTASDSIHTTTASVTILVTDDNDHSPVFNQTFYSFQVHEDADIGATVARVTALDADLGENARVTYQMTSDWGRDLFQLDSILGTFTLIGSLDYETRQLYALKIAASDQGSPPRSSTVDVYMNVVDVNDNQPVFDPATYSHQMREDVPIGNTVLNISATDVDSGRNGEVRYSLVGDSNLLFTVDPVTGTIQTAALLDRETRTTYTLDVMATDQAENPEDRLSTTAEVTVILLDVNDCPPEFTSSNVTQVKEETSNGTVVFTVTASDRDAGINSDVTFTLAPVQGMGYPFLLDKDTGHLKVNSVLRREVVANYTLRVTATDGGSPALSTTQQLAVYIEDVNNNPPVFSQNVYRQTVPEDVSVGTSLLRVVATDVDEGLNGVVRYFIVSGDDSYDFALDMASGVLRLQKNLDHERVEEYTLTVRAEDSGVEKTLSSEATVIITVSDVNDFQPVFDDSPYIAYVQEGMTDVPVEVTTVTARDEDSDKDDNNKLTYQLRDVDNDLREVFSINELSGQIMALTALDRELTPMYTLTVIATDAGIPRLTGTGTLTVYVKDVNDHAPKFDSTAPYVGHVTENGIGSQSVITVTATDLDEGVNAQIRYRLEDSQGDRFTVLTSTGEILTNQPLDREEVAEYHLVVIATDQGIPPKSSSCSVTVYVDDENDNAPAFELASYSQSIADPTNTSDFVIGVTAVDKDSGNNGKVAYSLLDGASRFHISTETGVVTAAQRLSGSGSYTFQVRASDLGQSPKTSTVNVTVQLQSVSETPPTFAEFPLSVRIPENSLKGTVLTTVSAVTSRSPRLTYHIVGGNVNSALVINEDNGTITVAGLIDYEVSSSLNLWLMARDRASVPLSAYKQLTVTVLDVNDNMPRFSSSLYEVAFTENRPLGSSVIQVKATDADSGSNGQVEFRIVSGNENNTFQIHKTSGLVTTLNAVVDREGIQLYNLVVEAADLGTRRLTATSTVRVTILDLNDNPPVFSGLFSMAVPEDMPLYSFILTLTSTDKDTPANANVTYQLISGPESLPFAVDPISGNITNIMKLDAETKERYRPFVRVSDSSYASQTQITIRLLDVNDNAPQFASSAFVFDLREGQPVGTSVGKLSASDLDISQPNNERYFSLKRPSLLFELDAESGVIRARTSMEYRHSADGLANIHTLDVVVTDLGMPSLSSEATVTISITDANNHAPVFELSEYMSAVPQNAGPGVSILTVQAHDFLDYGLNAQVRYSISSGNGSALFGVAEGTGVVSVKAALSSTQIGQKYVLTVTATDQGQPPQSSSTRVVLTITPTNTYQPVFRNPIMAKSIPEDVTVGHIIDTISASDQDQGLNGEVRFNITGGNNKGLFKIDPVNGYLTVNGLLDYETVPRHVLQVTARDMGLLSLSITKPYTITLVDVNDNSPVFSKTLYNAFVPENSKMGTIVATISAADADSGNNAIVKYSIVGDVAASSKFAIHEDAGTVTAKGGLDYETRSVYTLAIMAYNPAGDPASTTVMKTYTEVRVYVTGVNEYYPRFVQREYRHTVSESAMMNTTLLTIHATDDDLGVDGVVYYYLVGPSNLKGFALDPVSGALRVVERPDYESSPRIELTALAKNWGAVLGNDTDICSIVITVEDANDPPVFTQPVYIANVLEGSRAATSVVTIMATDNDIRPENRNFNYAMAAGNEGSWFRIDANTGRIETTGLGILDRETVPVYDLRVVAVDAGIPAQTGTCTVRVFLDDVNDNPPVFDPPKLIAYVTEGLPAGMEVITLENNTTDPDASPNKGPYTYEAVSGNALNFFQIQREKGLVRTKVALNREENPEFLIPVVVRDNGQPAMSSTLTFTVRVSDVNNSPPRPRPLTVRVTVLEGMSPVGIIADVRPLDEDLEGNYSCLIVSGASTFFNMSEGCDLRMRVDSKQDSHQLTIAGTDGSFPNVTYVVKVETQRYTQQALNNAVAVLLETITPSDFLENKYVAFKNAVVSLLGLSSSALVFSVQAQAADLFVYLSVTDEQGGVVSQVMLAQKLRENKVMLGSRAGVRVKDAAFQRCSVNPCQHNGQCATRIVMSPGLLSNQSPLLTLTSATPALREVCICPPAYGGALCEEAMQPCGDSYCSNGGTCVNNKCSCPPEWTSTYCQTDVDECVMQQPCLSSGTCKNTPGSFQCLCPDQFYGKRCENQYQCVSRPCLNGATCLEDLVNTEGGFRCQCAYGFFGNVCEQSSLGFHEGSYLTMSPITEYGTIVVTGHFATRSRNALLLFNPVTINSVASGFVVLEVVNGAARFSYKLEPSAAAPVLVEVGATDVSTGHWYRLEAKKLPQVASLVVQRCSDDGSTCEQCQEQDSKCYQDVPATPLAAAIQGVSLTVGGVEDLTPILQLGGAVRSHDFVGCAHSFLVNSRGILDLAKSINYTRISSTCPRRQATDLCTADTCSSGGQCVDRWSEAACLCSDSTTGTRCETKWQPFGFGANSKVTFSTRESYRRNQILQDAQGQGRRRRAATGSSLMLRVRTIAVSGVLYHASTSDTDFLLWLEEGAVRVRVTPSTQQPITMVTNVADAEWHSVTLTTVGSNVTLNINGQGNLTRWRDFGKAFDFGSVYINTMSLGGGRVLPDGVSMNGFAGCVSEFRINGAKLPLNGSSERYDITSSGGVTTGCSALCDGGPCGGGELCTPDGETFNCSADTGVPGPVAASSGLEPGIIVIIVFFILLLITIVIVFVIFRLRRSWFNRCLPTKSDTPGRKAIGGGNKLVGSQNSLHSSRDTRYADNSQLEEMIIRNHIAEELAGQKTSSLTAARPDLIGSNLSGVPQPTQFPDGTMIIENIDQNGVSGMPGLSGDDMPEHYDLENASSIAPSDSDVIQHYQRYRHANDLKAHLNNHNLHPAHRLSGLAFRDGVHQRQSPVSVTGSALSMPARNSPLVVPGQSGRPSSALAALGHPYGPRDSPRVRASPLTAPHTNTSQGSRSNSAHSLGSHHSHSSSSSNPHMPNGHGPHRGGKGGKGQGRYQRGLTVDEVNRLNARADLKNTASMLEAVSSSSDDPHHPHHHHHHLHPHARAHLHNPHLQRLRGDEILEGNVLLEPPDSSSSDSGANDSFTCSEFEYDNERDRGRLDPGTMIFSKLTEVDEDDAPPARNGDSRNSNGDSVGSTVASDDANIASGSGGGVGGGGAHHGPSGPFDDFDALLNLGPSFDKFVGVFKDIALLPDSNNQALEGATSNDYEEYV